MSFKGNYSTTQYKCLKFIVYDLIAALVLIIKVLSNAGIPALK